MRYAIVSDIHGNLEALTAIERDLSSQSVDAVLCLGDSIGYGPNPIECLDWSARQSLYLLGNAEESTLYPAEIGGEAATETFVWTRAVLSDGAAGESRRNVLEELPRVAYRDDALFVHASPRSPLHEYLHPEVTQPRERYWGMLQMTPRLTFSGHTHLPGVLDVQGQFTPAADRMLWEFAWGEFDPRKADSERYLINVGSAGQARDGDLRACYVIWESNRLEFRRVEYDVETTIRKLQSVPELSRSKTLRWLGVAGAT